MSRISPSLRVIRAPVRSPVITSAAASGVTAKTPECIFTPAGTPSTNGGSVCSARAEATSRAVPSPPAKSKRSIPAATRARTACCVSAPVLSPSAVPSTEALSPAARAAPSPMAPPQVKTERPLSSSPARVRVMRPGARGWAPRARASARTADPSEPFRAVAPPIPAQGFTTTPKRKGLTRKPPANGRPPAPPGPGPRSAPGIPSPVSAKRLGRRRALGHASQNPRRAAPDQRA